MADAAIEGKSGKLVIRNIGLLLSGDSALSFYSSEAGSSAI